MEDLQQSAANCVLEGQLLKHAEPTRKVPGTELQRNGEAHKAASLTPQPLWGQKAPKPSSPWALTYCTLMFQHRANISDNCIQRTKRGQKYYCCMVHKENQLVYHYKRLLVIKLAIMTSAYYISSHKITHNTIIVQVKLSLQVPHSKVVLLIKHLLQWKALKS